MKILNFLCLALLLTSCLSLLPLIKQKIGKDYQIGTIQQLLFMPDKSQILFKSDDDLFGFINEQTGELKAIYELEEGQEIISASSHQIFITKNKKLNLFATHKKDYFRIFYSTFIERHPNFNKILDIRVKLEGALILTDKYLMKVPNGKKPANYKQTKEQILIQLSEQSQSFYNLSPIPKRINQTHAEMTNYITSLKTTDKINQLCIRSLQDEKHTAKCMDIKKQDKFMDVQSRNTHFVVQFEEYILVLTKDLELIQKINENIVQYHAGFITIGDDHKMYDPRTKKTMEFRVIKEHNQIDGGIKMLKVQEKSMTIKEATFKKEGFQLVDIIAIPKQSNQNPRKVWCHTPKGEAQFRFYVEFDDGTLVSYEINKQNKKYQEMWELKTIPAKKVVDGKLEAEDIDENVDEKEDQEKKEDINESKQTKEKKP